MNPPSQPQKTNYLLYLVWVLLIGWTMTLHWLYPFIVFGLGAVVLHNTGQGGLLQRLIQWVQVSRKVDLRRAQQLTFAAGMLVVALSLPVVAISGRQAEDRRMEVQRQETLAANSRAAAALAERTAADARAAAARAETERLIAQKRATDAATAAKRQADQALADQQKQAQRDAQAQQDAAQRATDQQARQQRETQAAANTEAVRLVAEGPYTSSDTERMCKQAVAEKIGVTRSDVHQQGSYIQQMDARPTNMAFGQGRLWFWRPILEVAGIQTPFKVLCRVHDDGKVEVTDP